MASYSGFGDTVSSPAVTVPLQSDDEVVLLRKIVREHAVALRLSLVDQTKLVTAASELARNTLKYGGGGEATLTTLDDARGLGLQLTFVDHGPGIADVARALTDGYTSGGGLGLGLGGAKRLVDEFDIRTAPGDGTVVSVIKWKR
ncbi:MAG: anti-sigma regulatory factor [Burkholderiaceae bacterium]